MDHAILAEVKLFEKSVTVQDILDALDNGDEVRPRACCLN